ncbi:potassium-transporting ATPase subunit KdpC [Rhizorhabdus dicambivorans]|uniref:Potassium-transporting ATPase KdpC subunit n=1 Tax=Rhizorhabdus dicambivorans TaxID=1850238 RepID=A0A2A4FUK1_9SPHN|nr:potassium-transporting ATPase subunit KdpC [Rhizorhabdus dicambivorans]ATE65799.1 potassium-transporting ATPase subunit KdpC [Rhizorhabdus dicambivorans]PCE41118.1 potassium-transporting ATPase subunit KdpC [Rhizorhabdus dicambivorans]
MGNDFTSALRPAIVMTVLFAILLCVAYPMAVLGIGQTIFPSQANGRLVRDGDKIVGSTVIGQAFTNDRYFQTRPSAAGKGYDGLSSSGSNYGPTSQALVDRVKADVEKARGAGVNGPIPGDLVTASGSGLDPDLSPAAALAQVSRVARARGLPKAQLRSLVEASTEEPLLGLLGEPRVNVFALNRQLDQIGAKPSR